MPALAEDRAAARKAQIDDLLAALKNASSETEAVVLEGHLRQLWLQAGSPAVTLLMARGLRDLKAASGQEAEQDFDGAIALDPEVAEAYDQRALARFQQGKVAEAIRDIEEALKHEPRDFFALRHLAEIAEAHKDWPGAFAGLAEAAGDRPQDPGRRAEAERTPQARARRECLRQNAPACSRMSPSSRAAGSSCRFRTGRCASSEWRIRLAP